MQKTPLWSEHVKLGARMVPFAGYEMPVQYTSVIEEHKCVRQKAGLFDVSHMGLLKVVGKDARKFLQHVLSRDLSKTLTGSAAYSLLCQEDGNCVDDLIAYCEAEDFFWLVLNASNKNKDFAHLQQYTKGFQVELTPKFEDMALLALQGPNAQLVLKSLGWDKPFPKAFTFLPQETLAGIPVKLAFTGYTGESGCEIFVESSQVQKLWSLLLEKGAEYGLKAIGLAARDTLRTEMGYSLYGHELSETINPLEAGLSWAVGLGKKDFIGSAALEKQKTNLQRKLICLKQSGRQAPRPDMRVFDGTGKDVGYVTSGTFAPSLECAIGLALVNFQARGPYSVDIRGQKVAFEEVSRPFYKKS